MYRHSAKDFTYVISNLGVGVKESEHSDFNPVAIQGAGTQL